MKSIEEVLPLLQQVMKLISNTFGSDCEIVLHDWSKGYDRSIIAIENGSVTNRKVGDCGSNLGLEVIRGTVKDGDCFNYVTRTPDNKTLKSSTIYLKNDEGEGLGALCVNLDITNYINFNQSFVSLIGEDVLKQAATDDLEDIEFHANDVGQLTDHLIDKGLSLVDKPVDQMTKEDKLKIIHFLDAKGTFLISKSGNKVCNALKISKFTLYNYLDIVRAEQS